MSGLVGWGGKGGDSPCWCLLDVRSIVDDHAEGWMLVTARCGG